MKRSKKLFAFLLTIFSLAFIVFVGFMQQQFNNPEFTGLSATTNSASEEESEAPDEETDADETDSETVAGAAGSMVNNGEEETESEEEESNAEEAETEIEEVTTSVRTVTAETLNARTGPGVDYDIAGVLVLGQTVEVEDAGNEWVRVTAGEITGYVNERYLSDEE